MTREKARREIDSLDFYLQNHTDDYSEESHTAMVMAIKALEQEPCEDAISREAVKELFQEGSVMGMYHFLGIDELPSVTPKKDEWIPCSEMLPENDEDVLTTNGIGINICWIDTDDHKWRLRNDDYIMDSVIAWMPLPKRYEYKGDNNDK